MVGNYLKCYCALHQTDWDSLLTNAEFSYNSFRNESIQMTPFEADLGWLPKSPLQFLNKLNDDAVQSINELNSTLVASFRSATFA